MVSINRKVVSAAFAAVVIATIMWLLGTIAVFVMPSLPPATPYAFFIIGFGGAFGAVFSEDLATTKTA